MRILDQPLPTISGDHPGEDGPTARWPADLFLAIERVAIDQYVWDDETAEWDAPGDPFVWDDPGIVSSERIDATCSLHGIVIEHPPPDQSGRWGASSATFTLDNRDGAWSQYDAQGRLVDYLPGRAVEVWAELAGEPWWLFAGYVTAWRELSNGTVEVEAFDAFTRLQAQIGTWTPGAAGDLPPVRLEAVCDLIGYDGPRRFDGGEVNLLSLETEDTPLEHAQDVAASDGGGMLVDADGTLLYRNRLWRGGRPDQTWVPYFTDNLCEDDL